MAAWIDIRIQIDDTTPTEATVIVGDGAATKTFTVTQANFGELVTVPDLTDAEVFETTGNDVARKVEAAVQEVFGVLQYREIQRLEGLPAGHAIWSLQPFVVNAQIFDPNPAIFAPTIEVALTLLTAGPYVIGQTITIQVVIDNQSGEDFQPTLSANTDGTTAEVLVAVAPLPLPLPLPGTVQQHGLTTDIPIPFQTTTTMTYEITYQGPINFRIAAVGTVSGQTAEAFGAIDIP